MSNELESDRAMVMNLESFGVDGAGYDETDLDRAAKFDKPAVKITACFRSLRLYVSCLSAVFVFVTRGSTLVFADMI